MKNNYFTKLFLLTLSLIASQIILCTSPDQFNFDPELKMTVKKIEKSPHSDSTSIMKSGDSINVKEKIKIELECIKFIPDSIIINMDNDSIIKISYPNQSSNDPNDRITPEPFIYSFNNINLREINVFAYLGKEIVESKNFKLFLKGIKPSIIEQTNKPIFAYRGETRAIYVKTEETEGILFLWYKNNKRILRKKLPKNTPNISDTLFIENCNFSDYARYKCIVQNEYNLFDTSDDISLTVMNRKPEITSSVDDDTLFVNELDTCKFYIYAQDKDNDSLKVDLDTLNSDSLFDVFTENELKIVKKDDSLFVSLFPLHRNTDGIYKFAFYAIDFYDTTNNNYDSIFKDIYISLKDINFKPR